MDLKKLSKAIQIIEDNILTPVIYMIQNDFKIEFICFCNSDVTEEDLYNAGEQITQLFGRTVEVVDIYEYDENDRMDVISNAELVYSEHPMIEQMFTLSVAEEYRRIQEQKQDMIKRKQDSGAYYLQ